MSTMTVLPLITAAAPMPEVPASIATPVTSEKVKPPTGFAVKYPAMSTTAWFEKEVPL